jgi:hypothetical protein
VRSSPDYSPLCETSNDVVEFLGARSKRVISKRSTLACASKICPCRFVLEKVTCNAYTFLRRTVRGDFTV